MRKIVNSPSKVSECCLLQNDEQHWFLDIAGHVYPLDSDDFEVKMSLLPFLEIEYEDLPSAMRAPTVSSPLYFFIKAAFFHGSPTWITDALQWLKRLEKSEINKFKEDLKQVKENKNFSQTTRQLAQKLLKK